MAQQVKADLTSDDPYAMNRHMPRIDHIDYIATGNIDFAKAVFLALQDREIAATGDLYQALMEFIGPMAIQDDDYHLLNAIQVVKVRNSRHQIKEIMAEQPFSKESAIMRRLERKVKQKFPEIEPVFRWGEQRSYVTNFNGRKIMFLAFKTHPDAGKIPVGPNEVVLQYNPPNEDQPEQVRLLRIMKRNPNGEPVIVNYMIGHNWKPGSPVESSWITIIENVNVDLRLGAKWTRGKARNEVAARVHEYAKKRQTT